MKKFLLVPLVIALIVGLLLSGCAPTAPAGGPSEIKVGCAASLTGMYGAFADGGVFGLKAAFDDINKQGGVNVQELGRKLPINLIVTDTQSDPIRSGPLAQDMVLRDKVNFLISHNEPPPMHIGTAKIANQYKIPQVIGSSVMEPWLEMRSGASPSWNYTWATGFAIATPAPAGDFRAKPGYTVLGTWFDVLGQYANQTNKKVGLFASNDPDGLVWYEIFGGALKENGFEPIGSDKKLGLFPMETTDYSSIINEWKNNNCDILWGNCPSPNFATLYRQARSMGLKPKIVMVGRAPLYYTDVKSWGGDLPNGVGVETFWDPAIKDCPGIGDTTPQSLFERWTKEKNQPLNFGIAWGYMSAQTLIDAIQRAGSIDSDKVNQALAATDMKTMMGRVKYDENQFSRIPVFFGQWFKTNTPYGWELKIVYSNFDSLPATGKFQFPIP